MTPHEANLSAESNPPSASPWLPGPHEDSWRPRHLEAPSGEGSQAPGGVDALQVAVSSTPGQAGSAGHTGGFTPSDRLLRSREFEYVLRHGRRTTAAQFVVLRAPSQASPPASRLGITVSKRVGNAVVRNRVKRRVREWFRRRRAQLGTATDLVVIGRPGAGALGNRETWQLLDGAIGAPAVARR